MAEGLLLLLFFAIVFAICAIIIGVLTAESVTQVGLILIVAGLLFGWPILAVGAVLVIVDQLNKKNK